ncbi:MAG: hypothetical protein NVSMB22_11380 [Chloroflexota bacterium]
MTDTGHAYADRSHRRIFIQDVPSLRDAVSDLEGRNALGVDLEMGQRVQRHPGGLQEWKHVLALVQIASDDVSCVIDPLRCTDLSALAPLMAGPTRKVFLGGGQDVALLAQAGVPAFTMVDVGEVALGIWGRREDGMASLARRMFGLSLDKTVRRADWLARPLNPALLTYAYQDAELTLMIYRWLQIHHPSEVQAHERRELDPPLPATTPRWLQAVMKRSPGDALLVLAENGLSVETNADRLTSDVRELLRDVLAPRQLSRVIRISAELQLHGLRGDVTAHAASPTSVVRSAVARALGTIGDLDESAATLEALRTDTVEEVRKAAEGALKDLRRPTLEARSQPEDVEAQGSIDESTRTALQALMQRLEQSAD